MSSNLPPGVTNSDLEPPESALEIAERLLDFKDIASRYVGVRKQELESAFAALCNWTDGQILLEELAAVFIRHGEQLAAAHSRGDRASLLSETVRGEIVSTTLRVSTPEEAWPEWARPRYLSHQHRYDHIEPQRLLEWALALERRVESLENAQDVLIRKIAARLGRKELIPQLIRELQELTEKDNS